MTEREMFEVIEAEFKKALDSGVAYPAKIPAAAQPKQAHIQFVWKPESDPTEFERRYAFPAGRTLAHLVCDRGAKFIAPLENSKGEGCGLIVATWWAND